jgi:hypothetical protein
MRRLLTATLLPLLATALVLSVVAAVLLRAWNVAPQLEGGARERATDTAGLAGHDLVSGYKLATMFAVDDPGLVENLPADEAPDLAVTITPAPEGGWNLDAHTRNFAIALPVEHERHVPGRAHLHVWLDGDYLDDFLTPRRWVPPLPPGVHEIVVNATTVDHRLYARDGTPLVFRLYVRSGDLRGAGPVRVVTDADARIEARRGELLRLDIAPGTTERSVTLDGYGWEAKVGPRAGASFVFLADQPGTFALRHNGAKVRDLIVTP